MIASRLTTATAAAAVVVLVGSAVALAAGDPTPEAPPRIAVVARGDGTSFADALAVGSVAGQLGAPVFTTPATQLVPATEAALADYAPELVIITGGAAAISEDVEAAVETATGLPDDMVVRAAGDDRYETAAAIAAIFEDLGIDAAFLPVGATATDSDLIDGLDSSELFLQDGSVPLGGPLTYATPQERTLVIPGAAFVADGDPAAYGTTVGAGSDVRGADGTQDPLVAPVDLPHGAVVTSLEGWFHDTDDTANLTARLRYDQLGSANTTNVSGNAGTTGDSGYQHSGPIDVEHTVDLSTGSYFVEVEPFGTGTWSTSGSLKVEAILLTYTITTEQ